MIQIHLSGDRIFSTSPASYTLEKTRKLGEKKNKKIYYSNYEAYYLIDTIKAQLLKNNKPVTHNQSDKQLLRNKNSYQNYLVFKKLRSKGYIVKTAIKFGCEFRVYEKNKKHAKWLVTISKSTNKLKITDIISKSRIAHSTAKKLLLATIDSEEHITFQEIDWVKL
jgi:tRNA-intron endonuclease, archaea type